jgi:hypothetical protein
MDLQRADKIIGWTVSAVMLGGLAAGSFKAAEILANAPSRFAAAAAQAPVAPALPVSRGKTEGGPLGIWPGDRPQLLPR